MITSGQRTHLGGTWPYKAEKEAVPSKFGEILHFPTTVVTEGKGKETVPDNIRKKEIPPGPAGPRALSSPILPDP